MYSVSKVAIILLISLSVLAVAPFAENDRQITPPPFDGHPRIAGEHVGKPSDIPCLSPVSGWIGLPDKYNGKAYKAWGPGIKLENWAESEEIVEEAARNFIDSQRELFGLYSSELRTVKCKKHYRVWFVIFDQVSDGRRIHGARIDMRITPDGRVYLFGNQAFPGFTGEWPSGMPLELLSSMAGGDLGLDYNDIEFGEQLWLPLERENGVLEIRPVQVLELKVLDPPSNWRCFVDIETGETLMRLNTYYYFSGYISATVSVAPVTPWNTEHTRSVRWGRVVMGSYYADANDTGYYNYSTTSSGTAYHRLTGTYMNVEDLSGAEPEFSQYVSGSATLNIHMDDSNSESEERCGYVWAMRAKYNHELIDPDFTDMDWQCECNVNISSSTCNAYWDGSSINFYQEGGGCENTAQLKDVVMHEYTHGITDAIYDGSGYMPLLAMNEAWSDFWPCTDADSPHLGRGFFGASTYLRNVDNTLVYPDDWEGESHHDGMILGGALWDMRENLGPGHGYTDTLFIFARYGLGYNFFDYYYDILAVDDDDGDISNGTPHYCEIASAFYQHGIGDGPEPILSHTPLGNTMVTTSPYVVDASVLQCATYSWDADSVVLRWSSDGETWNTVLMTTVDGVNYTGDIPAQTAGTVIRYGIIVKDLSGNEKTHPPRWPMHKNIFAVGSQIAIFEDDFESDLGWTGGWSGDDASTGQWVCEDPYQTYNSSSGLIYQAEDDHTVSPGVRCWVTGNAPMSSGAGYADVDDGKVSLVSPSFDLSGYADPVFEYWRWFTNETSLDDSFWVEVSSNGGTNWYFAEYVPSTENQWTKMRFAVKDIVDLTSDVRFLFRATDYRDGSLTEGMIDDFAIWTYVDLPVEERDTQKPNEPRVAVMPNPFNASVQIGVVGDGMESIKIFDINGRMVRDFPINAVNGVLTVTWDGRGTCGEQLSSGLYLIKVEGNGGNVVRKITLIR